MDAGARFTLNIIDYAAMKGADREQLLSLTGKSAEELNDDKGTIPRKYFDAVMMAAVQQTADANFGLHFGEFLQLSAATWLMSLIQSADTLRRAFEHVSNFAHIDNTPYHLEFEENKEGGVLWFSPYAEWEKRAPESVAQTSDFLMAFVHRGAVSLSETPFRAMRCDFAHGEPTNRAPYERILNAPLRFGQDRYGFHMRKVDLDGNVVFSNSLMHQHLLAFAMERLGAYNRGQSFTEVVRGTVMSLVRPEFPSLEQVADNLGQSVRSVQRKLSEEGESYKGILDNLRMEYAQNYLQDPARSVKEVAYLLGYGDVSAFVRAFKRWTGQTPNAWRKA